MSHIEVAGGFVFTVLRQQDESHRSASAERESPLYVLVTLCHRVLFLPLLTLCTLAFWLLALGGLAPPQPIALQHLYWMLETMQRNIRTNPEL